MDVAAYVGIRSAGSLNGEGQVGLGQVRVKPVEAAWEAAGRSPE